MKPSQKFTRTPLPTLPHKGGAKSFWRMLLLFPSSTRPALARARAHACWGRARVGDGVYIFRSSMPQRLAIKALLFCLGLLITFLSAAAPFGSLADADDYPSRPIRLLIPFPPGGGNDVVGRIVANQLGQKLGQTVFVDNRSGAGGVVGTDVAAKAAPDGYTLLVVSIAHAVDPFIYKEPYDQIGRAHV